LWWYKPFWKSHNGFWKWFLLGPTYHKKSPKRICKFNEALHIMGTMCVLKSWKNVNLGATSKENQNFVAWFLKVGNGIIFKKLMVQNMFQGIYKYPWLEIIDI
jgi:hypothetical protein